jgi:hypothetical protein
MDGELSLSLFCVRLAFAPPAAHAEHGRSSGSRFQSRKQDLRFNQMLIWTEGSVCSPQAAKITDIFAPHFHSKHRPAAGFGGFGQAIPDNLPSWHRSI